MKKENPLFFNGCFDKGQLKNLVAWFLNNYGEKITVDFLENLKQIGFHQATKAGISLGLDDLQIPTQKATLISQATADVQSLEHNSATGSITSVEKSQRMIDTWNQTSEVLRQNAVQNFRNTNPVNPVYMMAFSGARGNISQVRQLVAMRGLMADPQGAILEFPIQSNFREGLTITEYLISCYGARKGLVDTALRTATSGYLTRRLVDAVQHVVVSMVDCGTEKGIFLKGGNFESRLVGRVLAQNIQLRNRCQNPKDFDTEYIFKNEIISPFRAKLIAKEYTEVLVRSPLTCESHKSICQLCYGWNLANGTLVNIGEAVGVIAAQSIGEPGTQLTMRTFHTGGVGVFSDQTMKAILAPFEGKIEFPEELTGHFVRTPHGKIVYMLKYQNVNLDRTILKLKKPDVSGVFFSIKEKELPAGSLLLVRQGERVKLGQLLAQSSQIKTSKQEMPESTHPVSSTLDGEVYFESMSISKQKHLPIKTKKRKKKEDDVGPDIRTLLKLGNFWVFASENQKEYHLAQNFVQPGDLVSPSTSLFQYNLHVSKLAQLNIVNSRVSLGLNWLKFPSQTIRFHNPGYSLVLKNPATKFLTKDIIFYLKTSQIKCETPCLIWYPAKWSVSDCVYCFILPKYFEFADKSLNQDINVNYYTDLFINSHWLQGGFFCLSQPLQKTKKNVNSLLKIKNTSLLFHNSDILSKQGFFELIPNFLEKNPLKIQVKSYFSTRNKHLFLKTNGFFQAAFKNIKSRIFFRQKYSSLYVGYKLGWMYIPSLKAKKLRKKNQNRVFIEPNKLFDQIVFEKTPVSLELFEPNKINLLQSRKYLGLNKSLILNQLKQTQSKHWYLLDDILNQYIPYCKKNKTYPLAQHQLVDKINEFSKNENTDLLTKTAVSLQSKDEKEYHISAYFSRKIMYFSRTTNTKKRSFLTSIDSTNCSENHFKPKLFRPRVKLTDTIKPTTFVLIQLVREYNFPSKLAINQYWASLSSRENLVKVKSPLFTKQKSTLFGEKTSPNIKVTIKTPQRTGWFTLKHLLRVEFTLDYQTRFKETIPSFAFYKSFKKNNIPGLGFHLFLYNHLVLQNSNEFTFQTFQNGWVVPGTKITKGFVKLKSTGEFRTLKFTQRESISSIMRHRDFLTLKFPFLETTPLAENIRVGGLVRWGQEISLGIASPYNGQILKINHHTLTLRLGIPILASARGILHVFHGDLLQKNDLLITLKSRRLQTEDIVQGIPKIEQLFEARETQGGEIIPNSVHTKLQTYFVDCLKSGKLSIAVPQSVKLIQAFLVENILQAYSNQGVKISEKHVEVVVRQMTTRVRILAGGDTGLLPGELVQLTWIQELNNQLCKLGNREATYEPLVLGITKSVLQSESFLLAASFQEVSRVLVRSALSRKTDFLRGLHENVILGQLIPAGTGLLVDHTTTSKNLEPLSPIFKQLNS